MGETGTPGGPRLGRSPAPGTAGRAVGPQAQLPGCVDPAHRKGASAGSASLPRQPPLGALIPSPAAPNSQAPPGAGQAAATALRAAGGVAPRAGTCERCAGVTYLFTAETAQGKGSGLGPPSGAYLLRERSVKLWKQVWFPKPDVSHLQPHLPPASPTERARRAAGPTCAQPDSAAGPSRGARRPPPAFCRLWVREVRVPAGAAARFRTTACLPGVRPRRPLGAHTRRASRASTVRARDARGLSRGCRRRTSLEGAAEPGKRPGPPKAGALRASPRGRVSAPTGGDLPASA